VTLHEREPAPRAQRVPWVEPAPRAQRVPWVLITKQGKKWTQPRSLQQKGLRLKIHHSALLVAYLEQPNYTPRALIGEFLDTTTAIQLVLTGPSIRNGHRTRQRKHIIDAR
jgi:hypothetical protein